MGSWGIGKLTSVRDVQRGTCAFGKNVGDNGDRDESV